MKKTILLSLFLGLFCFTACQNSSQKSADDDAPKKADETPKESAGDVVKPVEGTLTNKGLKLVPFSQSPAFEGSKLTLSTPADGAKVAAGEIPFSFKVDNYELGNQTPDADEKMCANSAKGQHIHLILNNQPYSAHYTNEFTKDLQPNHYVALAFLSRSYHESLKHKSAYQFFQFTVGEQDEDIKLNLVDDPYLVYSRPKGTYIGADNIKRVMLDFYLVNTTLTAKGYQVRATINGTPFTIEKWQPYYIEGLPEGKNTVKLELVDSDGDLVQSPMASVERTFELYEDEPTIVE